MGIEPDRRVVLNEECGDCWGRGADTRAVGRHRALVRVHWVDKPRGFIRLRASIRRISADHSLITHSSLVKGFGGGSATSRSFAEMAAVVVESRHLTDRGGSV